MKIEDWANLSGAFMINFGAAEIATFQWITKYATDLMVRDMALVMPLNKRIKLVCDLVNRSELDESRKRRAIELWGEIAKLSEIRNTVAYSPFVQIQEMAKTNTVLLTSKNERPTALRNLAFTIR
jgi:hypothetical protein